MRSRKEYFRARNFLLLLLLFALFAGCRDSREKDPVIQIDLSAIKKRGKLIAITGYSATSYFIYKGQPMGYEYELLTRLAQHLGVELEIKIDNNFVNMFQRLNRGEGDLIAYGLTVTQPRKKLVNFTDFLFTTRQVLVQRRPDHWRTMQADDIEKQLLRNPIDLIGKTVYVKKASAYEERLKNLSQEIGGKILIREVGGDTTTEQLIEEVALGNIDFTVSDQHIAMINQAYYNNLDVNTPISLPQRIAWAIRKNSPDLLSEVNNWIEEMKGKTAFYVIYNKYFKNRRAFVRRLKSDYLSVQGGKISPWDSFIKKQAQVINWDWRLLASLIFKESQFEPRAESWSGAVGLMQVIPRIGREYGIHNLKDPHQNIEAGVRYIKWLQNYWKDKIQDERERTKFVLASYNVGIGHVEDARKLALKYGRLPDIWDQNVAYYILRLSEEKFYTDQAVEFGYCRGIEPYNYVEDILEIYRQYSQISDI